MAFPAKLTAAQKKQALKMRQNGVRLQTIADRFGVTPAAVFNHTGPGYHAGFPARQKSLDLARNLAAERPHSTLAALGAKYGISKQRVSQILNKTEATPPTAAKPPDGGAQGNNMKPPKSTRKLR